jgi:hypothetical protein
MYIPDEALFTKRPIKSGSAKPDNFKASDIFEMVT